MVQVTTFISLSVFCTHTVYLAIIECQAESDVKNYADQGGCYPPKLETEVDYNILRDLHNSSHHTKAQWPFNSAIPPCDNYIMPCCDWPIFLGRQNMKIELCNKSHHLFCLQR